MALRNLPIKTGQMFIGMAVIMGLVTVGMFSSEHKADKDKKPPKIETQAIVVPSHPIMQGEALNYDNVKVVQWPSAFLPRHSTFDNRHDLIGRVALQNLYPGEPIFQEKVSGANSQGGLPALIPEGMRAVTVAVTEIKGVAGFVKPGDRVDVLTTFELEAPMAGDPDKTVTTQLTRTVLQNVMVLAAAQSMVDENRPDMEAPPGVVNGEVLASAEKDDKKKGKDNKKEKSERELEKERKAREKEKREAEKRAKSVSSVTLALTPEQAERLALAEETGEVRLALRSETDHTVAEVPGIQFDDLLEGSLVAPSAPLPALATPPSPPPLPSARYGSTVELIEGTEKTSLEF